MSSSDNTSYLNKDLFLEEVFNHLVPEEINTVVDVCKTEKSYKKDQELIEIGQKLIHSLNKNRLVNQEKALEYVVNSFYYLIEVRSSQSSTIYMSRIQGVSRSSIKIFTYLDSYLKGFDQDLKVLLIKEIEKINQFLEASIYLDPMREIFTDYPKALQIIKDIFNQDTVFILTNLNQVSKQTAKKWVNNGSIRFTNEKKIKILAVFSYYLRHGLKMTDDEIINWYQEVDPESNLKRIEIFNRAMKSKYRVGQGIRKLADSIGLKQVF